MYAFVVLFVSAALVGGAKEKPYREMRVLATAYCPCERCCGRHSDGITASGTSAYVKGIAVDRRKIKFDTVVDVPGYGKVIADDVGGAIKGNRIDVRFKTHKRALKWGRKWVTIKVYDK